MIWPLFLALTLVLSPVGVVMGELVLAVIYFVVFLVVGLVFRLMGRDSMTRAFDRNATTYRSEKAASQGRPSYFRQL